MSKLPIQDESGRLKGEQEEVTGLWLPRKGAKSGGLRSQGNYWSAKHLNIMVQADRERHAQHAVIAFPDTGAAYVVQDQSQLRGIIAKLQTIYDHIEAGPRSGQSVVSYQNRFG